MAVNKTIDLKKDEYEDFKDELDEMESGRSAEVGWFAGQGETGESGASPAVYMYLNIVGTETIPPRDVMSAAVDKHKSEMNDLIEDELFKIASGRSSVDESLHVIGIKFRKFLKNAMRDFDDPPNAEMTIEMKSNENGEGGDNPLIDTGTARNAVTHKVTG